MAEVELRIKPTVIGSVGQQIRGDLGAVRQFDRDQHRALRDGTQQAMGLKTAYERIERSVRGAGAGVSSFARNASRDIFSIRTAVLGVATGMAGRTLFDMFIGSNAKLEQQRTTFRVMLGDANKADKLIGSIIDRAKTTPFQQNELIEGSKRFLRLTGDNVEENLRLLNLATQMAAVNPEKTVTEAAEAILDAEMLEFERLKEFGIKLRKTDIEGAKKRGETIGQASLRGIEEAINKQTGGRDVVAALSETAMGRFSTIKDRIANEFRELGESAFEESKKGLGELEKSLDTLFTDPEFKRGLDDVGTMLVDAAKAGTEFARSLPETLRQARELAGWIGDHKELLLLGGGALLANRWSGGGLGRAGGGALIAGGKRALFGKGKGGAAANALGSLAGGGGDAMPVYVVNMGSGGMGGGGGGPKDWLTRNTRSGKGLGKGLTTVGALKGGGLAGAAKVVGAGGVAGMLAIPAAFIAAYKTLEHTSEKTLRNLEIANNLGRDDSGPVGGWEVAANRRRFEGLSELSRQKATVATGGIRDLLDQARMSSSQDEKRQLAQAFVATTSGRLGATKGKDRTAMLAALESQIDGYGLDVSMGKGGRAKFSVDKDRKAALEALRSQGKGDSPEARELATLVARGEATARQLNGVQIQKADITLQLQATGDAAIDAANYMQKLGGELTKLQQLEQ